MSEYAPLVVSFSALILAALGFARTYGYDRGATDERNRAVDEKLKSLSRASTEHYAHAGKREIHVVAMERSELMNRFEALTDGHRTMKKTIEDHAEKDERFQEKTLTRDLAEAKFVGLCERIDTLQASVDRVVKLIEQRGAR